MVVSAGIKLCEDIDIRDVVEIRHQQLVDLIELLIVWAPPRPALCGTLWKKEFIVNNF